MKTNRHQGKAYRHVVHSYFLNPTNPISVNIIGVGATGNSMLTALARINKALTALGHAGLDVYAHDGDIIETPNLARQLFFENELGLNKAVALINRINRSFGTRWKAVPSHFSLKNETAQLTITCVDNVAARLMVAEHLKKSKRNQSNFITTPIYWLDCGNDKFTGQVIISTVGKVEQPNSKQFRLIDTLPMITDEYSDLLNLSEKESNTPSCSLAEALDRQDLFVNTNIANIASSLIWNLFRKGILRYRGFFLNLDDFRMQPIMISK